MNQATLLTEGLAIKHKKLGDRFLPRATKLTWIEEGTMTNSYPNFFVPKSNRLGDMNFSIFLPKKRSVFEKNS